MKLLAVVTAAQGRLASGPGGVNFVQVTPNLSGIPGLSNLGSSVTNLGAAVVIGLAAIIGVWGVINLVVGGVSSSPQGVKKGFRIIGIDILAVMLLYGMATLLNVAVGLGRTL